MECIGKWGIALFNIYNIHFVRGTCTLEIFALAVTEDEQVRKRMNLLGIGLVLYLQTVDWFSYGQQPTEKAYILSFHVGLVLSS